MTKKGNQKGRQREGKVTSSKEERGRDRGSEEARWGREGVPMDPEGLLPQFRSMFSGSLKLAGAAFMGTHSPARKPLFTHHHSLKFRPWIRKPRPGDCQRWQGLQGAFRVLSGGILGGLVLYWGAGMVLSFAGHSPSGPPGTHGQHHHYKPSRSAALLTRLPQGGPWPLLRISVSLRPTVLKELVLSSPEAFPTYIASSICLRTTGNNLTVQCGRFFKHSQRSREEAEGLLGRGRGVGVPVSL